jgi:hypothetical protein
MTTPRKFAEKSTILFEYDTPDNTQALYFTSEFKKSVKKFGLKRTIRAFKKAMEPKIEGILERDAKELQDMVSYLVKEIQRTYLPPGRFPWDEHQQGIYANARDFLEKQLRRYRNGESIYVWGYYNHFEDRLQIPKVEFKKQVLAEVKT